MRFAGVCAFPITPAAQDGSIDGASLRRLLRHLTECGIDWVGVLGSTGTYAYLDRKARRQAIEIAAGELGGGVHLLAGIGALRTDDAVTYARDARDAGAHAVLLAPISYTPLTQEEVFTHFRTVAAATDLPLCIYNNPATTHFNFNPELTGRLSREANILAIKNPAPAAEAIAGELAALRDHVAEGFSLGFSVDWHAAEALLCGGGAWYSVAAGLFPKLCLALTQAAQSGDTVAARACNERAKPLWDLFIRHGSLRVIHAAAQTLGFCTTELPRPLQPVSTSARLELENILQSHPELQDGFCAIEALKGENSNANGAMQKANKAQIEKTSR